MNDRSTDWRMREQHAKSMMRKGEVGEGKLGWSRSPWVVVAEIAMVDSVSPGLLLLLFSHHRKPGLNAAPVNNS